MSQRAKRYLRRRGFVVGLLTLGLLYVPVTVVGTQEAVVVNFSQEKDPIPDGWELPTIRRLSSMWFCIGALSRNR